MFFILLLVSSKTQDIDWFLSLKYLETGETNITYLKSL